MFVQVIEGSTKDPDELHHRIQLWQGDLLAGAAGYLGVSGGCTDEGDCVVIARFEDAESARVNSERPEQSQWWAETEKCFDGPVRFDDSDDVKVMRHGELDSAGFLQVMAGHVSDRDEAVELGWDVESMRAEARPDLLGSFTAYFADGRFTQVAYFTSESAARDVEARTLEGELAEMMDQWHNVMKVEKFLDIKQPWLLTR